MPGDSPISQLPAGAITGANVDVDADYLAIDDVSAGSTKKITPKELIANTSSFTQSGIGAVATDVETELRYFIRPEQFGAVGDNSTDDKAAFDLALVAAANRILYITKPHKIDSNITFPSTITLLFDRSGAINPATGVTVTMNSDIHSVRKVADTFGGAGTVTIAATCHRIFKDQFKFDSTPSARGCSIGTGTGEGPQFDVQFYMTGDWTSSGLPNAVGFQMDTQLTPRDVTTVCRGMQLSPKLKTKTSGTHPDFATLYITPDVEGNGAAVSTYAGIQITTATLPGDVGTGAALILQAPTGAATNYAIWAVAGETKLDGALSVKGATTLASDGAANPTITVGGSASANNTAYLKILPSNSAINWEISSNSGLGGIAGSLAFTPSTAGGGSTFSTPILHLTSTYAWVDGIAGVGQTPSSTTRLILAAGTTGVSSLRMPHGSAPTSPVNGDIWTTTAGLFVQVNGSTVGPLS